MWFQQKVSHMLLKVYQYSSTSLYIIGHNYHGHYLHAGGLSVNNYVRENKVREVYVRE